MNDEGNNDLREGQTGGPWHDSVDWEGRRHNPVRRVLNWLERISLALERPVERVVGNPAFNPLYHTGTITTFLLLVILVTGAYLTFFYQFGFDSSYQAVAALEGNLVGRVMRAVHRYASAAAVFTALLHGWRTFFQDRFRGPRWLAWVSGIGMAALVWLIGVSGYWLIWDERAQLLNQTLFNLIGRLQTGGIHPDADVDLARSQYRLGVHGGGDHGTPGVIGAGGPVVLVPPAAVIAPQAAAAANLDVGGGGLVLLVAVLVPVGMIPQANFERIPAEVPLDLFFLFYLPAALGTSPGWLWGGLGILLVVLSALPWMLAGKPQPPIQVSAERCTGCTLCAADCPYQAIQMVPGARMGAIKPWRKWIPICAWPAGCASAAARPWP